MEATGFGLGAAAGMYIGSNIIASALGVALMATPVGWVLVIGVGITAGYFAAKKADQIGQGLSGYMYDTSKSISWTSF